MVLISISPKWRKSGPDKNRIVKLIITNLTAHFNRIVYLLLCWGIGFWISHPCVFLISISTDVPCIFILPHLRSYAAFWLVGWLLLNAASAISQRQLFAIALYSISYASKHSIRITLAYIHNTIDKKRNEFTFFDGDVPLFTSNGCCFICLNIFCCANYKIMFQFFL